MKNPFDALGGSDDQATGYTTVNKKDSEKRTYTHTQKHKTKETSPKSQTIETQNKSYNLMPISISEKNKT